MALLEARNLAKRYGRGQLERVALRNVSFELSEGELLAIWGRRNSGRSTLMRIVAGLETPDRGAVVLGGGSRSRGRASARGDDDLREQVRYCRKTYRATEGQLVIDRLITTQLTRGIRGACARAFAHDALERAGAAHCATLKPSELDMTEAVLVGIARSLVHKPTVLVLDEPTLGVDLFERDRILSLLRRLADDGIAVLMSVGETTCLAGADRALSLAGGELHGELQPAELAPVVQLRDVASRIASA
jgi:ABC-type multidrug transport system ATPase subunit